MGLVATLEAETAKLDRYVANLLDMARIEAGAIRLRGTYAGPGRSPDRADAMVWAMSELLLGRQGDGPRVRAL